MTATAQAPRTRAIVVDEVLPHAPEAVWKALVMPERWLMANDFRPEVGHRFQFKAQPMGDWNGIVDCEVLECDPPRRLVYSWVGGSTRNERYGSALDSTVSFTLTPTDGGTRLKLVHDGFKVPENDAAFDGMKGGWARVPHRLSELISTAG